MRVAVVGATGNIGTRLVGRLLAEGSVQEVVGIASRLPGERGQDDTRDRVRYVRVDLGAPDATTRLTTALDGVDAVVHLAWLLQPSRQPELMERVNVGGSRAVLDAVTAAGVPVLVYASSLGVYSPQSKRPAVREDAPTDGTPSSVYSRQKVVVERMVEAFDAAHPEVRVARIRPSLVVQPEAGAEQARYFLGRLVPHQLVDRRALKAVGVLPLPAEFVTQVVHAADIADLFARAVFEPTASGAYNGAGTPELDPQTIASAFGVRWVRVPLPVVRGLVDLTWRTWLQPTDPGWVDLGASTPLMDSSRARDELGWRPTHDARTTLVEAVDGVRTGGGSGTPPLRPRLDTQRLLRSVADIISRRR